MDLKCNCLNCQNPPSQIAMETSPQFHSNKRYEMYGNGNAFENQVLNIPERQFEKHQNCEWFFIEFFTVTKDYFRLIFQIRSTAMEFNKKGIIQCTERRALNMGGYPQMSILYPIGNIHFNWHTRKLSKINKFRLLSIIFHVPMNFQA